MDREKAINCLTDIEQIMVCRQEICPREELQYWIELKEGVADALAMLIEQQPKAGHWLKKMSNYPSAIAMGGSRTSACDLCGGWGRKNFKYCPHCGAKMEGR